MTSIESVILEVADPTAARRFYTAAFGLGTELRLRASEAPVSGFRGFTLSLTVSQPATVSGLINAALGAGATPLKPAAKSLWGYGGVVQAPDGTIWKVATSAKKDTGPATRQIDQIVLLLGAADVAASKRFYVRPRPRGGEELWPQVRRVRHAGQSREAGALRAPCPRQGRRRPFRRHRIAPGRDGQRCRALHRPGWVRVGGRIAVSRAMRHNGTPATAWERRSPRARPRHGGQTGDQTDQESRSAGHRVTTSVMSMDITIHASSLPHDDPEASLAFYRDTLGFEVRADVGSGKMRWITVAPPGQPDTSILLAPPATDPGITGDERRVISEMMAKGTYGWILLATKDLDGTFERLQASDAEVVQEPTEQPYGVRDCAFRDPAGNLIRIQELR